MIGSEGIYVFKSVVSNILILVIFFFKKKLHASRSQGF